MSEFGGAVTYTVTVTNTSSDEAVTLTSLVDDKYGNLDAQDVGNHWSTSSTCDVPQPLAAANAGSHGHLHLHVRREAPAGAPARATSTR